MSSVYDKIRTMHELVVPDCWQKIKTIDMHTGGEPLRVIVSGFPKLQGNSVLEYRNYVKAHYDHLRTALMFEPRGHADMYGCLMVPPNDPEADLGILFMHNEGYSTMCGHAVIAITKLAVQMGWVDLVEPETKLVIDAPCGRIEAYAKSEKCSVTSVYFDGVPSFVAGLNQEVNVPGIGPVQYDLAYGGAFYAYVDAEAIGLSLDRSNYETMIRWGKKVKASVNASSGLIEHPFEEDLSFLYGTIFIGPTETPGVHSKNVCVFAEGEVDRSPTGSGVSGRMAIHRARGEINPGETIKIESITGSVFSGSVREDTSFGPHQAVIPRVEGTAYVVGKNELLIDPQDSFKDGFIFR